MIPGHRLTVRQAHLADRSAIGALTRFEPRVHSHLDWRPFEGWLGFQPFLVAERGGRLVGALACPPDPPDTAWVRLFTSLEDAPFGAAWEILWGRACEMLQALNVGVVAALSRDGWLDALCESVGFKRTHAVVVLACSLGTSAPPPAGGGPAAIRSARYADHDAIAAVDLAAFHSPWQMSPDLTRQALAQADFVSVADVAGAIVGYQLTTWSKRGAHLARLAVRPEWQGRGVGAALVSSVLEHYPRRGAHEITVNTQDTNGASLKLYQRLGFTLTGARFPVFQYALA